MESDKEKNFKEIIQENISNGTKTFTRNPILRSLNNSQKQGEIEDFGDFKAVVYRLTNFNSNSNVNSNSNTCQGCANIHPPSSIASLSQRSALSEHSRGRGTPTQRGRSGQHSSQLSSQASLLASTTPVMVGDNKKNDKDDDTLSLPIKESKGSGTPTKASKTNTDKCEGGDSERTGESDNPRSTVFLLDDCNHIYRLSFSTTNVNVVPLAFNDANLPTPENEKSTQANSTDHYKMKYFKKHARELNYVHYYELSYEDPKEGKKGRPVMPKCSHEVTNNKKETAAIASPQRKPSTTSSIYVNFERFRLLFHPTTFIRIDRVSAFKPKKNEDQEYTVQSKQGLQPQHEESAAPQSPVTSYQLDTGNLTVFQNNDVYGIFFCMSDCILERIVPFHQLATATPLPDLVYCRITSLMSQKKFMYAPVPRSTYYYDDPMRQIVYKNRNNRLYGLPPEWKAKKIQERMKQEKRNKYATMVTHANRMGSCRLYFAANNIHIRARSKVMKMLVDAGEEAYDEWSLQEKRRYIHPEIRPARNSVCRICNQILQPAETKSALESVDTMNNEDSIRN